MQTAVNGNYYAFVNIEAWFGPGATASLPPILVAGFKAVNYDDELTRVIPRGTLSVGLGGTRGKYTAKGSLEIYLNPMVQILRLLGPGWKQAQLSMSITYGPDDTGQLTTDILPAFFLSKFEASQTEGDEPLARKCDLFMPGQILWDGVPSVIEPAAALAIG
jgi:hypothetical protein